MSTAQVSTAKPASAKPSAARITSLDQFRGYTVAGMFLVNFVGGYAVTPLILKHSNNYCSYADTIMPQFFFAVGFAFRLTFGRRAQADGLMSAYGHVVRRLLGLALVAMVVYGAGDVATEVRKASGNWQWSNLLEFGFWNALGVAAKRSWFQTLMHIAVTSLWITPVIRSSAGVRVAYMLASAAAGVALSYWFYFNWSHTGCIDGGPLGFLMWTIPTMMGTLACDAVTAADGRPRVMKMIAWSVLLMGLGYLFSCPTTLYNVPEEQRAGFQRHQLAPDPVWPSSERLETHTLTWCEPPFVPPPEHREWNYWMMSQRAATLSYHTFAAGFSLCVYALFFIACDVWGWQLAVFRTLGTNALVGYILHGIVDRAVSGFMPKDSPGWYVTAGFLLFFGITWLFIRHLEKNNIYLKL